MSRKSERTPMRERIGWAVVSLGGLPIVVSPYQRRSAIREFVDPNWDLTTEERRAEWKNWLKKGVRAVKVRISPMDSAPAEPKETA